MQDGDASPPAKSLAVSHDPDVWLFVPKVFPDNGFDTPEAWAATQAGTSRLRGFRETGDTGSIDSYFLRLIDLANQFPDNDQFWVLLPDDAPGFLAATLDMTQAETTRDEMFSMLTAQTPNLYERPAVSEIEAAHLGTGIQVLRYDRSDDSTLVASLYFAFRHEDYDVVLRTQTEDLAMLNWSRPALEQLIDGVEIESAT